jgi:hypothetical protein
VALGARDNGPVLASAAVLPAPRHNSPVDFTRGLRHSAEKYCTELPICSQLFKLATKAGMPSIKTLPVPTQTQLRHFWNSGVGKAAEVLDFFATTENVVLKGRWSSAPVFGAHLTSCDSGWCLGRTDVTSRMWLRQGFSRHFVARRNKTGLSYRCEFVVPKSDSGAYCLEKNRYFLNRCGSRVRHCRFSTAPPFSL